MALFLPENRHCEKRSGISLSKYSERCIDRRRKYCHLSLKDHVLFPGSRVRVFRERRHVMVIVTNVSFGKGSIYETQRGHEELPPIPEYMNMMGTFIKNVKFGGGIETIHLFEFDASRLEEARDFINERMEIYNKIAELTYSVDLWLDLEDVFSMTGLETSQTYASA
jgi:uncharacterized protein (DUF952 family)